MKYKVKKTDFPKQYSMNYLKLFMVLGSILLGACTQIEWEHSSISENPGITFKLYETNYENELSRSSLLTEPQYDRVEYYIVDADGELVNDIKSSYNSQTAEISVEGLHTGNYSLLVLSVKGDESKDHATIHKIQHASDLWLVFPEDLQKPLEAEYFYSQTPFSVYSQQTENGEQEVASLQGNITQKRIISKADFHFDFNNPYVEYAVTKKELALEDVRFYTHFSADGSFSGESNGQMEILSLDSQSSYHFLPTVEGRSFNGTITLQTRHYRGSNILQTYHFEQASAKPNCQNSVKTKVAHPDDQSGVLFMTETAYNKGNYGKILQDGEPKEVYTDPNQRRFNTSQTLQLSITDNGQLHARFYSPRNLGDVLIKAHIPAISNEYIELAYFDTIPAFADFYQTLPVTERTTIYRTESGRQIQIAPLPAQDLVSAEFKIESSDGYWAKLQQIKHGWDIYWGLYGGNPDLPDGGPVGNWMGIRPVHCRETVAMFINFTYMIDTPEHEQILRENEDILYGNGGVTDKVTAERVLEQMRQKRTLQVGLVYTGNNVLGLGGGTTFGAYQQAWLQHYFNTYSCEIMFHELGHVMGYSHSSSFTYGPWAQQLMNHFYANNLKDFPIDSPNYLNSSNNPTIYK